MNYSKQLSVFVPTHIIDADTKPYLNNEMIEKTVLSAYERLGLDGVKFFIYPDAKFKRTHPKLSNLYYDNLNFTFSKSEFDNVEVIVVDDSRETMRNNWQKFIEEDCDTPYMLFLEHDWEFLEDIPLDKILNTFEKNPDMGYIKFNKSAIDNNMRNLSSWHNWDLIYEQETKLDIDIPLFKVSFFSGNPHIARTEKCREFYLKEMMKHCPPEKSKGTSHLEKDMKKGALRFLDANRDCGFSNRNTDGDKAWGHQWPLSSGQSVGNGCKKCEISIRLQHKVWGTYMYGNWGDAARVGHLGDWCRKR